MIYAVALLAYIFLFLYMAIDLNENFAKINESCPWAHAHFYGFPKWTWIMDLAFPAQLDSTNFYFYN